MSRRVGCAGLTAAVCLAACGVGADRSATPAPLSRAPSAGSAIDPDRQPPAQGVPGAREGGIVRVSSALGTWSGDLKWTLDPSEVYYTHTLSILSGLVTRSLTQYAYDAKQDTMVLLPDLATDIGTPNRDYTEWTYTIRPGVRFEDGSEVTADDVAYGIKRSFDRKTFPDGAAFSNDYFLDGDNYAGPYASGTKYDGVVVHGDTLTLKMARPFPDMPYWAAFPAMGPIPESGSDPATYARHPLATGPYKVADFVPRESLRLVRNHEWDASTDPGRHAYPDEYRFEFDRPSELAEASILRDTRAGATTVAYDDLAPDVLRSALADARDRVTVGSEPCVYGLAPDYRKITDLRVRQAVGYAYPYESTLAFEYGIAGTTINPGRTLLPPGNPARVDYNPLSSQPGETDPVRAKQLLRAAGYEPGEFTLRFTYDPDDPDGKPRSQALAAGLEEGGFRVVPYVPSTHDEFVAVRADPSAPLNLRPFGWCTDWPSGSSSLLSLLVSTKRLDNFAFFSEPEVDDEIERIGQLPLSEQPAAWGALDRIVETKFYPYVVTKYGGFAMLHGSRIGGLNADGVLMMPTWKDLHVLR